MPDLQTVLLIIIAVTVAPKAMLFIMQFVPLPAKLAEVIKKLAANGNGNLKKEIITELETNHFHGIKDNMKELISEFRIFAERQNEHSVLEMEILRDIKNNLTK